MYNDLLKLLDVDIESARGSFKSSNSSQVEYNGRKHRFRKVAPMPSFRHSNFDMRFSFFLSTRISQRFGPFFGLDRSTNVLPKSNRRSSPWPNRSPNFPPKSKCNAWSKTMFTICVKKWPNCIEWFIVKLREPVLERLEVERHRCRRLRINNRDWSRRIFNA